MPAENEIQGWQLKIGALRSFANQATQISLRSRLQLIGQFHDLLISRAAAWIKSAKQEIGKSAAETLGAEILPLAEACRFLEGSAAAILKPRKVGSAPFWLGDRETVVREPHGIVAVIGTWNYPFFLSGVQILHALAAGNRVIWKPSETTPLCARELEQSLRLAGFGEEWLVVLPAERDWGPWVCEQDIDWLVFTGAEKTGRNIARILGERLIPSTLELSGHDPMIVLGDAPDSRLAAMAAWFGMTTNNGQTCVAARRLLIDRSLYEKVLTILREKFASAAAKSLASDKQKRQALDLIATAKAARCAVTASSADLEAGAPNQMVPVLVETIQTDLPIWREALFAPVLIACPFDREEQITDLLGHAGPALGASIFSADVAKARRLADTLNAGLVTINDLIAPLAHPGAPFGGRGKSGWGVTQGAEGLLEMTRAKTISVRSGKFRPHYDGPWSGNDHRDLLWNLLKMSHAPSWRERAGGFWGLITGKKVPMDLHD